ncbi:universal stress protein [Tatumella ptyseos]|uniref:universal stress protein n=1 Tax=Tatumella ptyseos TaxID=82987 RepID=UPI0026F10EB7|nr:universal stress protein [Tatumella ptyseos]WKX25596.1 universal stress protein [Tatumella ptyseos]
MNTVIMAIDHQNNLSTSISHLTLREAQLHQASVIVICCIPTDGGIEGEVMNIECGVDQQDSTHSQPKDPLNCAERTVRAALVPFQRSGVPARGLLCRGEPAAVIVEQATKLSASMIIMGRRHLSPFNRLFKGSISAAVLETASCPVLIDLNEAVNESE